MTSWLLSRYFSHGYDSTVSVAPCRRLSPPVRLQLGPPHLTPIGSNGRCDAGYCADRPPRSEGLVGLILSRFHNNSFKDAKSVPNPYSHNSVKSTTATRPATRQSPCRSLVAPSDLDRSPFKCFNIRCMSSIGLNRECLLKLKQHLHTMPNRQLQTP
jgi:hypothetical protein